MAGSDDLEECSRDMSSPSGSKGGKGSYYKNHNPSVKDLSQIWHNPSIIQYFWHQCVVGPIYTNRFSAIFLWLIVNAGMSLCLYLDWQCWMYALITAGVQLLSAIRMS